MNIKVFKMQVYLKMDRDIEIIISLTMIATKHYQKLKKITAYGLKYKYGDFMV